MGVPVKPHHSNERETTPKAVDLEQVLSPARWQRRTRDRELAKALLVVRGYVSTARKLLELDDDTAPLRTAQSKEQLRDLLARDVDALTIDSAWELANALRLELLVLGDSEYVWAQLEWEAERDEKAGQWHSWSEHFSEEKLAELLAARRESDVNREVFTDAVRHLGLLYRARSEAALLRRTVLAQRARFLAVTTALVALALLGTVVAVIGARPDLWKTVLLVVLIGLAASPVIVIPRVLALRDELVNLDDLRWFWPAVRLAAVVSVAFSTGFAAAHIAAQGLSEQSGSTDLLLVAIAALVVTGLLVAWTGFWRRWIFWRQASSEEIATSVFASVVAVAALIEFFAILMVALAAYGTVEHTTSATPRLGSVEQYYAWHLADAIPALDVPETLNWERPLTFTDHLAGALLLGFKLLAILPVAGLIAILLQRRKQREDSSPTSAGIAPPSER